MLKHPNCDEPTCILGYVFDPDAPRGKRNPPCPTCRPARKDPVLPALKISPLSKSRHNTTQQQPNR